jgi:hypothetical protein
MIRGGWPLAQNIRHHNVTTSLFTSTVWRHGIDYLCRINPRLSRHEQVILIFSKLTIGVLGSTALKPMCMTW